jgi:hypothetical protein
MAEVFCLQQKLEKAGWAAREARLSPRSPESPTSRVIGKAKTYH